MKDLGDAAPVGCAVVQRHGSELVRNSGTKLLLARRRDEEVPEESGLTRRGTRNRRVDSVQQAIEIQDASDDQRRLVV